MLLGALIDAGLPIEALRGELSKLPLDGYAVNASVAQRGVIRGTHVSVDTGGSRKAFHSIHDFLDMVDAAALSPSVKEKSRTVLERLEEAEARVHGENHELQELGDIDTIIDVVGVAAGLELLGIEKLYSSPLPAGWGVVSTRKGALPVPAPATVQLMEMSKAKVAPPEGPYLKAGELVTPTGAALITTLASFDAPALSLERVGYGLGTRDNPDIPNVLALWIGEAAASSALAQVSLVETNIDDMSPEILGHVQEELMRRGALDAWFSPIQMKKNRPAVTLSVLCRPNMESALGQDHPGGDIYAGRSGADPEPLRGGAGDSLGGHRPGRGAGQGEEGGGRRCWRLAGVRRLQGDCPKRRAAAARGVSQG